MTTFVLTSGLWHGGWCYKRLAKKLRDLGHEVYCPTYMGVGEFSHTLSSSINLSTHIKDIINLLKFEELENIVLVGHSSGGMVITGVADYLSDKIVALVYLDAFVPENGQSQLDLMVEDHQKLFLSLASNGYSISPVNAEFFSFSREEDCKWVQNKLTPHPLGAVVEKISLNGEYKNVKNLNYILSEKWGKVNFNQFYTTLANNPAWKLHTLPCGHEMMIDMPDELAEILISIK